jgi:hypothetical protein
MRVVFLIFRLMLLALCVFALTRSASPGASVLYLAALMFFATDTVRVLAGSRGRR